MAMHSPQALNCSHCSNAAHCGFLPGTQACVVAPRLCPTVRRSVIWHQMIGLKTWGKLTCGMKSSTAHAEQWQHVQWTVSREYATLDARLGICIDHIKHATKCQEHPSIPSLPAACQLHLSKEGGGCNRVLFGNSSFHHSSEELWPHISAPRGTSMDILESSLFQRRGIPPCTTRVRANSPKSLTTCRA